MSPRPGTAPGDGVRDRGNRGRARLRAPRDSSTPLRFGYGTNGLTDLRLDDALGLLADLGYDGVGLTLDHMHLDPLARGLPARTRRVARRLNTLGLGVTVETGARYVLDPRRKHGPSLLDPDPDDRSRRVDLLLKAVRVAADLGAHAVHCFSGVTPADTDPDTAWHRLSEALAPVLDAATAVGVPLAIEPEPGHLLATLADFHRLRRALDDPEPLGLTLDIGHCQCLEPLPPADCVRAAAPWLRHVQIEDMRRGIHEHLPFGDGEIDFPPVLAALADAGYQGLTVVELPRHSHAGPHHAEHSLRFLHGAASTTPTPPAVLPDPTEPTSPRPTEAARTSLSHTATSVVATPAPPVGFSEAAGLTDAVLRPPGSPGIAPARTAAPVAAAATAVSAVSFGASVRESAAPVPCVGFSEAAGATDPVLRPTESPPITPAYAATSAATPATPSVASFSTPVRQSATPAEGSTP